MRSDSVKTGTAQAPAMMWFDGKYVMRSSSPDNRYNGGRECPNAWVYKAAGTFEE